MKLSKKTLLIIGIGIFVIILAGLGMVRSQQVQQQDQLNEELTQAQTNLNGVKVEQLSSRQAELEKQLSQATSQIETVKAMLSQPVGSITASGIVFDLAEANGVEVTEMTSSGPAAEKLGDVTFSVISLTARVEGDIPNLVSFVTELNSRFTTGVVKSITITIPETTERGQEEEEQEQGEEEKKEEKASADIQLAIYSHQSD